MHERNGVLGPVYMEVGDPRQVSVKCSHFGIFSVVNRPYFVSQTILYNVLGHRFLAKPNNA